MRKETKDNIPFLALAVISFSYILSRAILVPAYHDEINTFFLYVQTGQFQPFYSVIDQNNHVLNTLFSHLFFLVFGDSLFVLRLANVLSFAVYLYYIWKIGKTFKTKNVAISWFITMVSSLYFISFFSLSRGYGMSMAFFTASIYYLIENYSGFTVKSLLSGLFAGALALWAYLGLMVPVLLLGFLFTSLMVRHLYNSKHLRQLLIIVPGLILLFLIPLYYAIIYSFYIKSHSDLIGSQADNFLQAVIFNVTDEFSGEPISLTGRITVALILLTLIISTIINFRKNRLKGPSMLFHVLLWGTVTGTIAMHYLFGVGYPESRMAIYFFVLLMAPLYLSIDESDINYFRYSGYLVSVVFVIQFILTFNLSYAPCWKYDTLPVSTYNKIAVHAQKDGGIPTVSTNLILGRQLIYHDFAHSGKLNSPQMSNFPSNISDFIIANKTIQKNTFSAYDTVEFSKKTGVYLLQRKQPIAWTEVISYKDLQIEGTNEYFNLIPDQNSEPFREYPFCFDIEFKAQSKKFPFRCILVCDVWDKSNQSLSMNYIELQSIRSDVSRETYFHRRQYIENIPEEAAIIRFYFFNIDKTEVKFSDLKIRLFKGQDR